MAEAEAEGTGEAGGVLQCAREDKARLEARNALAQIDYLTYLVVDCGLRELRESHIRELQRLAIEDIYPCGGDYVDAATKRAISDGDHEPPHVADIQNLVTECVEWVNRERKNGRHEIECAAYAMWRINWIHPFRGGNGRSSRMVAYLIICMALGHMLPGVPSIPALIEQQRDEYLRVLRLADASLKEQIAKDVEDPFPDLTPVIGFLQPMVEAQVEAGVVEGETA